MPYLNRIEVMGNLGKDPELRYTPAGTAVTSISLAYTERWTDKTTNERKERTEWFTAVLYGQQAETVCCYMKKGDCLLVCGKLKSRRYTSQGVEKTVYEIIVDEMQMIHTRQQNAVNDAAVGLDYL